MIENFPYLNLLLDMDESRGVFGSEEFHKDAEVVARIDPKEFSDALTVLRAPAGFAGASTLRKVLAPVVADEQQREALVRFVLYFARNRAQRRKKPTEYAASIAEEITAAVREHLAEDLRATFESRLKELLTPFPAVDRQVKADDLGRRFGRAAVRVDLVCDLRPVFDSERTAIEGMLPITTMRVSAVPSFGELASMEVQLSEKQVADLCEKAEQARKKLAAIKKYLADHGVVTPATGGSSEEAK